MILTTTPTIEGRPVTAYKGVVGAEVIFGAMFLKDVMADATDTWGGRNRVYEKVFEDARERALVELEAKAVTLGASAVLNLRFDYQVLGASNGMMMVAATGTAVELGFSDADRAAQLAVENANAVNYYVAIDGRERGPFSLLQLRELLAAGKIGYITPTRDESGNLGATIAQLLGCN